MGLHLYYPYQTIFSPHNETPESLWPGLTVRTSQTPVNEPSFTTAVIDEQRFKMSIIPCPVPLYIFCFCCFIHRPPSPSVVHSFSLWKIQSIMQFAFLLLCCASTTIAGFTHTVDENEVDTLHKYQNSHRTAPLKTRPESSETLGNFIPPMYNSPYCCNIEIDDPSACVVCKYPMIHFSNDHSLETGRLVRKDKN